MTSYTERATGLDTEQLHKLEPVGLCPFIWSVKYPALRPIFVHAELNREAN